VTICIFLKAVFCYTVERSLSDKTAQYYKPLVGVLTTKPY